MISKEDVRILLSYIPFKSEEELLADKSYASGFSGFKSNQEGLYDAKKSDYFSRKHD